MRSMRCWAFAMAVVAAPSLHAQTQLLVVSGLGGDPKYTQEFGQLSGALAKAASRAQAPQ